MTARFVNLSDVPFNRTHWLWPDRIPYGELTLLVADPGSGKSTLTCDIMARVTTGKPMHNCWGTRKPHGVLLISAEDDLSRTVKHRLVAAGGATCRVRALDCTTGSLRLPSDLPLIERELGAAHARLIVIDPLMAFIEGNANSDQSMRKALSPLARLARQSGAAVILVHHINKSGGGSALHRASGSIGIAGVARSILLAAQLPGGADECVLAHAKNNIGPLARSLAYRRDSRQRTSVIEWLGESQYRADDLIFATKRNEGSALEEAIHILFSLLCDGGIEVKSVRKAATDAGVTASTLRRAKDALGVVSRRRGWGPGSWWEWRLDENHRLVRQLREEELSTLSDRLCHGDEDDDDDSADWWKRES